MFKKHKINIKEDTRRKRWGTIAIQIKHKQLFARFFSYSINIVPNIHFLFKFKFECKTLHLGSDWALLDMGKRLAGLLHYINSSEMQRPPSIILSWNDSLNAFHVKP